MYRFTLRVKSQVAAVLFCLAPLTWAAVTPSYGSSDAVTQASTPVTAHLRGPCTDGARYTLSVSRLTDGLHVEFRVYGKPGSKWHYEASARSGTDTIADDGRTMTVAPKPRPYWSGTLQWLVNLRPTVMVRALGKSRTGEVCRVTFRHRVG